MRGMNKLKLMNKPMQHECTTAHMHTHHPTIHPPTIHADPHLPAFTRASSSCSCACLPCCSSSSLRLLCRFFSSAFSFRVSRATSSRTRTAAGFCVYVRTRVCMRKERYGHTSQPQHEHTCLSILALALLISRSTSVRCFAMALSCLRSSSTHALCDASSLSAEAASACCVDMGIRVVLCILDGYKVCMGCA